ncbi:MAG: hypothetical protein AAGD35_17360 [Actinomycetota bacterium]
MSVDTYLKGKNTSRYTKVEPDDGVTVLVAPSLKTYAHRIELFTRKKLVGAKLVAVAHHEHTAACRH